MSDVIAPFVWLACVAALGLMIGTVIEAKAPPVEHSYRLKSGATVTCLRSRRVFSESLSCDWQHARKVKHG